MGTCNQLVVAFAIFNRTFSNLNLIFMIYFWEGRAGHSHSMGLRQVFAYVKVILFEIIFSPVINMVAPLQIHIKIKSKEFTR